MTTAQELMAKINGDFPEVRIAAAITGGGTSAIGEMLRYGGSSQSVLYAYVPYSPVFTEQYLGRSPDKLCSAETARQLAMKSYHDIVQFYGYQDGEIYPVGIGATSALGKITKEREGREHKIYVAVQNREKTITYTLRLTTARVRTDQESVNESLILLALAEGCNIPAGSINAADIDFITSTQLGIGEKIDVKTDVGVVLESVLCGETPFSVYGDDGLVTVKGSTSHVKVILPASFNPLHDAHREMARIAEKTTGHTCHFEMSIMNADKPPLSYTEIYRRLDYFDKHKMDGDLFITRLPTFAEKAEHFAPVTFVVGADTVKRICDSRFYGGSESEMLAALQTMFDLGAKFLCFSRVIDGVMVDPIAIDTPEIFKRMSLSIDSKIFASDISSTEIRRDS